MDAVKFLIEKERMCKAYYKHGKTEPCRGCPFEEAEQGVSTSLCAWSNKMWNEEDYVKTVEQWSNAFPMISNRMKFKDVFGFNPVMYLKPDDPWWEKEYQKSTIE